MGRKRQWWLHDDITKDFGENEYTWPFLCKVSGFNEHDSPNVELYFFKSKLDAYKFVCNYLYNLLNKWKKDIDERDFNDWKNLSWRLNYGSGDGPTQYKLNIEPLKFEYE